MLTMQSTSCKVCFKCGVEKLLTEFYKHPQMADGHLNKCKECSKKDVRENRDVKSEHYKEYDRSRQSIDRHKDVKAYRRLNPDKYKAHNAVNNAVAKGGLFKPEACEHCGTGGRIYGHHHSYKEEFWLDVIWLCQACHMKEHKRLKSLGIDPDQQHHSKEEI